MVINFSEVSSCLSPWLGIIGKKERLHQTMAAVLPKQCDFLSVESQPGGT